MKKHEQEKLTYWQQVVADDEAAWAGEREKMDARERIYNGDRQIREIIPDDPVTETKHVYNIVSENIESIVDSSIPVPKVTAQRKGEREQHLATVIEHMIRCEMDRMPTEELNDLQERTCPIQGATFYLVEWDEGETAADHAGEVSVTALHPKMVVPQRGVFTSVEDMDHITILRPDTKANVKRVYGIDVTHEGESDPEIKGVDGSSTSTYDELVTRKIVYYRNGDRIGKFHFVNNVVLEDLDDCQARRKRRCAKCGRLEGSGGLIMTRPTLDGTYPEGSETGHKAEKGECPYCHSVGKWVESSEDYMEILVPTLIDGQTVGGTENVMDEYGNVVAESTVQIPYYKPRMYPVIMQRNVSAYGQLMGSSDVDKIRDQQNSLNRLEQKMLDRQMKAGTRITMPPNSHLCVNPMDEEFWALSDITDKEYLGVYDFDGDLNGPMALRETIYQESRNLLGVTDSFQGRKDSTAQSGKAKEFSAQQSAGRMMSKRVMKHAAYSHLFELIFKLKLAYSDEPRPIHYTDKDGNEQYEEFDPRDFLRMTPDGEWEWDTDFLFSVDETGDVGSNRAAMWQEIDGKLAAGCFGDPHDINTLIRYWRMLKELHHPLAGQTLDMMIEERKRLEAAAMKAAQAQAQAANMRVNGGSAMTSIQPPDADGGTPL